MANNFALRGASDLPDMLSPWPRSQRNHDATVQTYGQARRLYRTLSRHSAGKSLPIFEFHDHGSLVSLSRFDAVGGLKEKLTGRSLLVEGFPARVRYAALYRMHLVTLHGVLRATLGMMAQWLRRQTPPRIRLH